MDEHLRGATGWTRSALLVAVALSACTTAAADDNDEVATDQSAYVTASPGEEVWSKRFGTELANDAAGVASDPNGNAYLVGDYQRSINLGGKTLTTTAYIALYLAQYDGYGQHLWSRSLDDAGARGAAASGTGVTVLAATDAGTFSVMRFASDGSRAWTTRFRRAAVLIAGNREGRTAVVGGDEVTAFDDTGSIAWTRALPASRAVAVDGAGNVFVGTGDGAVVKYTSEGAVAWTKRVAERIDAIGASVGGLVAAGGVTNAKPVVVKLGSAGELRFESLLPHEGTIHAVRIDRDGAVVITGARGTEEKMFLEKLTPVKGATWWAREYTSSTLGVIPRAMDLTPSGRILVAGTFWGTVDFGRGPKTSAGTRDAFLARFYQ